MTLQIRPLRQLSYFIALAPGAGNDSCHVVYVETLIILFYWQNLHFFEFVATRWLRAKLKTRVEPGTEESCAGDTQGGPRNVITFYHPI